MAGFCHRNQQTYNSGLVSFPERLSSTALGAQKFPDKTDYLSRRDGMGFTVVFVGSHPYTNFLIGAITVIFVVVVVIFQI